MLLQIEHRLHFRYSGFIRESHMDIRVEPRTKSGQVLLDFSLLVGPSTRVTRHEDWLGNAAHWFSITDYHDRIEVMARSLVDTTPEIILPEQVNDPIPEGPLPMDLWDFVQIEEPIIDGPALRALHAELGLPEAKTTGQIMERVGLGLREKFEYRPNVTDAHSTTDALLAGGGGVCQDFAHAALGLLRLSGIPARYVNGYLHVEREDDSPSQSHAWIEYWTPSHGWIGFDPTHGIFPGESHVIVAYGRSYRDVPPNRGIYQGGASETLVAEVITEPGRKPDRRQPAEELLMDLPVYSEAPDRTFATDLSSRDAGSEQQQQQQQ
ncbi:MAG: hypothetical protein CMJ39_06710 [Phycisphaerae bacterium]|nr:hypothetical protein [Phycisphaerae bacterium]